MPPDTREPGLSKERFLRRFSDGMVLAFGVFSAILVLASPQDRPLVPLRFIACLCPAAILSLVTLSLRSFPASKILWIARYATPLFFFAFYFRLTGQISPFFPLGHFDHLIARLDGILFGDPFLSMRFQETRPFSSPAFGELMCLSYVAYFTFMPVFGGILIASAQWRRPGPSAVCAWYVACVVLTYYLHYIAFFLFPVAGPAFHGIFPLAAPALGFDSGIKLDPGFVVNRFHHLIVSRGDVPGGCFPSSHVAIALLHALVAFRMRWPWLCGISAAIAVSICFSIVYTRTHYAADAVGGLISGLLCWFLLNAIERRAPTATEPLAPTAWFKSG